MSEIGGRSGRYTQPGSGQAIAAATPYSLALHKMTEVDRPRRDIGPKLRSWRAIAVLRPHRPDQLRRMRAVDASCGSRKENGSIPQATIG